MASKKKLAKKTKLSWELTLFLLKLDTKTWDQAVLRKKGGANPKHDDIRDVGTLVLKGSKDNEPSWVGRLRQYSSLVEGQKQRSPGAVLFIPAKGRLFAATFGYGRSLLAPERIVQDFGIRCVLNSVNPKQLRSMDLRTLEADPLSSRKQFGEGKPLASFGVDEYRDLLRGVAGVPTDKSPLISGADALHVRLVMASLRDLPGECIRLLGISERKKYKTDFGWIDHVRLVRDASTKNQLFGHLHQECKSGAGSVGYVVPQVREAHRLESLRGSWAKRADEVLEVSLIRQRLAERARNLDAAKFVGALKADRVGEPSPETGSLVVHWPLLDAVIWSTEHSDRRFVLSAGDWFELDGNFIAEVEAAFDKLVAQTVPLKFPAAKTLTTSRDSYFEREYNSAAARSMKIENLDRTSMTTGLTSAIEPCDLLEARRGIFVHVKDGRRSSVLSHLFDQGVVSLETFLSVAKTRQQVRALAKIGKTGSPLCEPVNPSKLTVVYAIVDSAPKKGPWRLPFFSMLAAKHAAERIGSRQAAFRIVRIDDLRA